MIQKQFSNYENHEVLAQRTFTGHQQGVEAVKFLSWDQHKFVSGSHDSTCKLWDVSRESSIQTFSDLHKSGVWDLQLFPSAHLIVTVSPDSKVSILDPSVGHKIHQFSTNLAKCYTAGVH